jgi:hypothetical protein
VIQVLNMISFVISLLSISEVDVQTSNFELRLQTGHDGVGCGVWVGHNSRMFHFVKRPSKNILLLTRTDVYLCHGHNSFGRNNHMMWLIQLSTRVIQDWILDNFWTPHYCSI